MTRAKYPRPYSKQELAAGVWEAASLDKPTETPRGLPSSADRSTNFKATKLVAPVYSCTSQAFLGLMHFGSMHLLSLRQLVSLTGFSTAARQPSVSQRGRS